MLWRCRINPAGFTRATRYGFLLLGLLLLAGCRIDMHVDPKFEPLEQSEFYADGQASRTLVAGTIPRGQLRADTYFYSGMTAGKPGSELPMAVTHELLERGHERFNIYCAPCHSPTGDGNGMIVQRGYRHPPSFHSAAIREAPIGHFYDVITNGFGAMPDYASQVPPRDRWAIAAYIRALQLSQHAGPQDLPPGRELPASVPVGGNAADAHSPAAPQSAERKNER